MGRHKLALLAIRFSLLFPSLAIFGAGPARAYDQYSVNKDATNCAACHGDFRAAPYISLANGESWDSDLMEVHATNMLNGDCLVCHGSGPRFPVMTNSSAGGTGLDPISCAGCHGRAEDGTGDGTVGFGAGLRQHHWIAGIQICGQCHVDANPDDFVPVGEEVLPPYYSDNDPDHPLIPSDPCNPVADGSPEDYAASTAGLDNDGDDLYDELDVIDCPEPGQTLALLTGVGMLGAIRHHNRRRVGR
ncbi:MAG TPA: hypothetical protein VEC18_00060 [Myxococcota bacterium]|nr:hypothetical protein [Myxococcota bacterium]